MLAFYLSTMLLLVLFGFMFIPGNSSDKMRKPFYGRSFAHRGLFTADQSVPENSLAAFEAAVEAGYGITVDLQITADRRVVAFNDNKLQRMCGVEGTLPESTYEELQAYPLGNSQEKIPLFSDVLALVDGQVPIIAYLKAGHDNETLCKIASELMLAYPGAVAMASYHPAIVGWFRDHKNLKQHILRGSLAAPRSHFPAGNNFHFFLVSHGLLNSVGRPQFIIWPDEPQNRIIRMAIRFGAVGGIGPVVGDQRQEACTKETDLLIFEGGTPPVRFKEQEDLMAKAEIYEATHKRKKNKEAALLDTYLETVEGQEDAPADDQAAPAVSEATAALQAYGDSMADDPDASKSAPAENPGAPA